MEEGAEDAWADRDTSAAVSAAVRNGLPPRALGIFARWWQLETWLRDLVYVELRAKHGVKWTEVVARSAGRQAKDAVFTHMESSDTRNPLAYLDYSQLIDIIAENWDLFGYALIERASWDGRQAELMRIRHRVGHMRAPHEDDLARLEQTLRDLERGTFIALASYNRQYSMETSDSPVARGWNRGEHEDARRLINHAEQNYETSISVRASHRPWASGTVVADPAPGVLWHVDFLMRGRSIDPPTLWRDTRFDRYRDLLVHVLVDDPWHVGLTFSAADSGQEVADAIGALFEAVLTTANPWAKAEWDDESWRRRARSIDYRVLCGTGWNIVDEMTVPISSFGAGGGVTMNPVW